MGGIPPNLMKARPKSKRFTLELNAEMLHKLNSLEKLTGQPKTQILLNVLEAGLPAYEELYQARFQHTVPNHD